MSSSTIEAANARAHKRWQQARLSLRRAEKAEQAVAERDFIIEDQALKHERELGLYKEEMRRLRGEMAAHKEKTTTAGMNEAALLQAVEQTTTKFRAEKEKLEQEKQELESRITTVNDFALNVGRDLKAEKQKTERLEGEVAFLRKQLQARAQESRQNSPEKVKPFPLGSSLPLPPYHPSPSPPPQQSSRVPPAPKPTHPAPTPLPEGPNKRMRLATDSPAGPRPQHTAAFAPVMYPRDFNFNAAVSFSQPQPSFPAGIQFPASLARNDNVLAAAAIQRRHPPPPTSRPAPSPSPSLSLAPSPSPLLQRAPLPPPTPKPAPPPIPDLPAPAPGSARAHLATYNWPPQPSVRAVPCLNCHANYWEPYCTGGSPCLNCVLSGLSKCERPMCHSFDEPDKCAKGALYCKRAHVTDGFDKEELHRPTVDLKRARGLKREEGVKIRPPMWGFMESAGEEERVLVEEAKRNMVERRG
ncbi:hypothetical protein K491DRAFT_684392 [Lophiostoma macrostomum CBS 122681]|uniref:C3H1-type domain-containing protein n=1 Tax=Lophiostoma macrostomum CBS 122681 TaxID=1314788 RepID=A0A6A6SLT7_9PLEO|nr:hypothetical protein K491DRAFT_684392 [Lophiostoma macrostomum CBS 122681]